MSSALLIAISLFAFCLIVHIVVWRSFPARSQGIRLGVIFLFTPVVLFAVDAIVGTSFRKPSGSTPAVVIWALAYLLHAALSGAYLFIYTAVSGFSPSIAILERVENSMPQGLPRDRLAPEWFTDTHLSGARRANLLATGFIVEEDKVLRLSARGTAIAGGFLVFRRVLGLSDMGRG